MYWLIALQVLCCCVFLFGDIGFDRPGRYGLGFGALLLLGAVYLVALVAGLVAGGLKGRWLAVGGQLLPVVAAVLYLSLPSRTFEAAQYQDLVGKPRSEVDRRIGYPRGTVTGFTTVGRYQDVEFMQVRGMIIYISRAGVVEGVEPYVQ